MNARELKMDDASLLRERDRQLAARRASRARTAPRRKAGADKKRLSREERNAKVAEIRREAFDRWGDNCAACVMLPGEILPATDLHHLVSGSGNRRSEERVGTVLPVCGVHHRLAHDGDLATLDALLECAESPQAEIEDVAVRTLERRIAKIEARARASSVRRAEGGR